VVCRRFLRILAVAPDARRRGIGSRLLAEAERIAAPEKRLVVAAQPGNYLGPGVDVTDGETIDFFTRRGYQRRGEAENMAVPLPAPPASPIEGYEVRRATAGDATTLADWIAPSFGAAWAYEVGRALDGGGVHVARRDGRPVAFAAHDGNNRGLGWFGPAATHPDHRGAGVGAALLLACLADVAAAGHTRGVIAWIGPRAFYEKTAGAVSDRRFLLLERALT
jgi:GNAT superfamily N-acetyltransferase